MERTGTLICISSIFRRIATRKAGIVICLYNTLIGIAVVTIGTFTRTHLYW